jgi:hypothetical protein
LLYYPIILLDLHSGAVWNELNECNIFEAASIIAIVHIVLNKIDNRFHLPDKRTPLCITASKMFFSKNLVDGLERCSLSEPFLNNFVSSAFLLQVMLLVFI